ncbi:hypothetical protein FQN54_004764 [Arachnomyces sp. PD_36]|nr:hypothetical protein FQN54_004764 [Arachnomyces sp. PD_36]
MFHIGYHVWEFPQTTEDLTNRDYRQYYAVSKSSPVRQYGDTLSNIPILPLAKASIIIILLRVANVIKPLRQAMYAVFVFNAAACIVPWAVFIFICPQLEGAGWASRTFGNLKCLSRDQQGHLLLFINCANLLTDVIVFPVPFFIMRELLCVTALSAVKIYVTFRDRILLIDNPDWMWSLEFCITHAEGNVGIIVACVPTLRGLVSRDSTSRRGGRHPEGSYPSFTPTHHYTSVTVGRGSGTRGSWSLGSRRRDDGHLLDLPSDIFMTTLVKSSLVDDDRGQTFGRRIFDGHTPRDPQDRCGDSQGHDMMHFLVENSQQECTPPTPLLPPPVHTRYL